MPAETVSVEVPAGLNSAAATPESVRRPAPAFVSEAAPVRAPETLRLPAASVTVQVCAAPSCTGAAMMTEAEAPVSSVIPAAAEAGKRSSRPPPLVNVTVPGVTPAEEPGAKASERTRNGRSRFVVIAAAAAESRWMRTVLPWPGRTVEAVVPARSLDQLERPADQFEPLAPCQ